MDQFIGKLLANAIWAGLAWIARRVAGRGRRDDAWVRDRLEDRVRETHR